MIVAAIIEYSQDQELVGKHRPDHRAYLAKLLAEKKLVASGPFTDLWGALIIYQADSIEQAEAILKGDPFYHANVFLNYQLRPWKPVMSNAELLPGAPS